jgi:predicted Zn-dependent peptidase
MTRRALVLAALTTALASCSPAVPAPPRTEVHLAPASPPPGEPSTPAAPYAMRETPDAPFRASAPELADKPAFVPPPIHSFRLANGIPVLFMEQHAEGFVRVELLLRAQPAPLGANAIAARNLWIGTKTLPQGKLQAANDADAALLWTSSDWGWIRVAMTSPADRVASSIARLATVALAPAFPTAEFIRVTREAQHDSEPNDEAPRSIVARVLPLALYGLPQIEDEPSELRSTDLGALRHDDIVQAYQAALDPASASLTVVGDMTEKALRPLLEKSFGEWHGHGKHAPPAKPAPPKVTTSSPRLIVVDHPGAQTLITFGGEGPRFSSPDWAPSITLRMLVGGPRGGVMRALHDASVAATYATVNFTTNPAAPRLLFNTEVPAARTADALVQVDRLLRATKTAEVPPEQLDDARRELALDEPSWDSTLAGQADLVDGLLLQGLPLDDATKRAARILAVTSDDVHRVAARYLDPDRMKIVVVGDWAKLRDRLKGLAWGPIEVRAPGGAVLGVEPAPGP